MSNKIRYKNMKKIVANLILIINLSLLFSFFYFFNTPEKSFSLSQKSFFLEKKQVDKKKKREKWVFLFLLKFFLIVSVFLFLIIIIIIFFARREDKKKDESELKGSASVSHYKEKVYWALKEILNNFFPYIHREAEEIEEKDNGNKKIITTEKGFFRLISCDSFLRCLDFYSIFENFIDFAFDSSVRNSENIKNAKNILFFYSKKDFKDYFLKNRNFSEYQNTEKNVYVFFDDFEAAFYNFFQVATQADNDIESKDKVISFQHFQENFLHQNLFLEYFKFLKSLFKKENNKVNLFFFDNYNSNFDNYNSKIFSNKKKLDYYRKYYQKQQEKRIKKEEEKRDDNIKKIQTEFNEKIKEIVSCMSKIKQKEDSIKQTINNDMKGMLDLTEKELESAKDNENKIREIKEKQKNLKIDNNKKLNVEIEKIKREMEEVQKKKDNEFEEYKKYIAELNKKADSEIKKIKKETKNIDHAIFFLSNCNSEAKNEINDIVINEYNCSKKFYQNEPDENLDKIDNLYQRMYEVGEMNFNNKFNNEDEGSKFKTELDVDLLFQNYFKNEPMKSKNIFEELKEDDLEFENIENKRKKKVKEKSENLIKNIDKRMNEFEQKFKNNFTNENINRVLDNLFSSNEDKEKIRSHLIIGENFENLKEYELKKEFQYLKRDIILAEIGDDEENIDEENIDKKNIRRKKEAKIFIYNDLNRKNKKEDFFSKFPTSKGAPKSSFRKIMNTLGAISLRMDNSEVKEVKAIDDIERVADAIKKIAKELHISTKEEKEAIERGKETARKNNEKIRKKEEEEKNKKDKENIEQPKKEEIIQNIDNIDNNVL